MSVAVHPKLVSCVKPVLQMIILKTCKKSFVLYWLMSVGGIQTDTVARLLDRSLQLLGGNPGLSEEMICLVWVQLSDPFLSLWVCCSGFTRGEKPAATTTTTTAVTALSLWMPSNAANPWTHPFCWVYLQPGGLPIRWRETERRFAGMLKPWLKMVECCLALHPVYTLCSCGQREVVVFCGWDHRSC